MTALDDLVAKMNANPDRGTPCLKCEMTAKDCQAQFLLADEKCCVLCKTYGGAQMHRKEN